MERVKIITNNTTNPTTTHEQFLQNHLSNFVTCIAHYLTKKLKINQNFLCLKKLISNYKLTIKKVIKIRDFKLKNKFYCYDLVIY